MLRSGTLTLGAVVLGLPVLMLAVGADDSLKNTGEAQAMEGVGGRARARTGMAVKSPADKDLGKVKDVVIDMETGTVRYVAISFGGFLGVGDKLFAVPFRALHVRHEPKAKSPHFEL